MFNRQLPAILMGLLMTALAHRVHAQELPSDAQLEFAIDHVGLLMERDTVKALSESEFLKNEFGNSRYSLSSIEGGKWSGFYINGSLTYLEFTDRLELPGIEAEIGDGMVALNAERPGSVDWIISRMAENHSESNPTRNLRHINRGAQRIPYSYSALFKYEHGHEGFGAWAMEYHPNFKNLITGGRLEVGNISRTKDAPPVRHHPEKYFMDVTGFTVAVTDRRRKDLVALLKQMQFRIEEQGDSMTCSNESATIELIPRRDQKYAITRIQVSLTRPMEGTKTYQFGDDVVLRFGDGPEAVWEFGGKEE